MKLETVKLPDGRVVNKKDADKYGKPKAKEGDKSKPAAKRKAKKAD